MQVTNPIPVQFPSTYVLNLSSNPHTLFVLKIIVSNPTIDQTITFYNQNGSVEGQPIVLTNSVEIKLRYVNFSKITFSDINSYNIFASIQTLQFSSEENLSLFMSDSDFNIVPINNADIISPLDINGYVEVDDLLLNAKIKTLNQDVNGNIGISINNPLDAHGNVKINGNNLPTITTGQYTTSSTANVNLSVTSSNLIVDEVTILADPSNTAIIYINSYFPLSPGASVSIKKINLNQLNSQSSAASQIFYLISGGT